MPTVEALLRNLQTALLFKTDCFFFGFFLEASASKAQSISSRISLGSYKIVTLHTKLLCRMCLKFLHLHLRKPSKFGNMNTKSSVRSDI